MRAASDPELRRGNNRVEVLRRDLLDPKSFEVACAWQQVVMQLAVKAPISLMSVADMVQALCLVISEAPATGEIYTVAGGQEYKPVDIERAIFAALGKRFPLWRTLRMVLFTAALLAGIVAQFRRQRASIGLRTYPDITHDSIFDNSAICGEPGFQPQSTF